MRGKTFSHFRMFAENSLFAWKKTSMENFFQPCHTTSRVRNIVLDACSQKGEYFPSMEPSWSFVSLEREFRVEKSDTRADYVYVERISNGQTDPIRRQVGLPKFSIMQRFTQFFHLSSFRRFFLFLFLFSDTNMYSYWETCSPKLERFANRLWIMWFRTRNWKHFNLTSNRTYK